MKLENLRIVVDERERKSGIPDLLKSIGMKIEMKTLPIGDYIVASETIVERKSIRDLMASVFDGRLYDQCSRLDSPKGPYLKKIKKSSDLEKQQLSVLCSLPGVGEKFAVRMLEKFGTPLKVFSATTAELAKIEGLGDARAKKIKKTLDSKSSLLKSSDQKTLHDS